MKQLVLIFSVVVAFLCGQTFAGATAIPVSCHITFVKAPVKAVSKNLLTYKLLSSGKDEDAKLPVFPKKKRSKGLQQEFLVCQLSEVQFAAQELPVKAPSYHQNNSFSVLFLPNGKRGPPALN